MKKGRFSEMGALNKQRPQVTVAGLCDSKLRIASTGLTATWSQPEETTRVTTLFESMLVLQRKDKRQRGKRPPTPWICRNAKLSGYLESASCSISLSNAMICLVSASIGMTMVRSLKKRFNGDV